MWKLLNWTSGGVVAGTLGSLFLWKKYINGPSNKFHPNLEGKYVIITGANTGIGKETALEIAKLGATVVLACRDEQRTLGPLQEIRKQSGNNRVEFMPLDLSDLVSVKKFCVAYRSKYNKLDILINNAGVMACPHAKTQQGFEMQLGVNHLGHMALTHQLLDLLKRSKPSRVIVLSSSANYWGVVDMEDLNFDKGIRKYSPVTAYGQSKLANIMYAKELSRQLKDYGVSVVSLHPGAIRSDLMRHFFAAWWAKILEPLVQPFLYLLMKDTWYGAQTTLHCALTPTLENGAFYCDCALKTPNKKVEDDNFTKKFYQVSFDLIKPYI